MGGERGSLGERVGEEGERSEGGGWGGVRAAVAGSWRAGLAGGVGGRGEGSWTFFGRDARGEKEPDADGDGDAEVAVEQDVRRRLEALVVGDAIADRVGDGCAGDGAGELEDDGQKAGLLDRQGLGADRGGVCVGNIIGTDSCGVGRVSERLRRSTGIRWEAAFRQARGWDRKGFGASWGRLHRTRRSTRRILRR